MALKIVRHSHHGLRPRYKMGLQVLAALAVGIVLLVLANANLYNTRIIFPFFKRQQMVDGDRRVRGRESVCLPALA